MFCLIALGTGAAYLYSVFATFAPGMFPAGFREMGGTVAVYFEAAAVITVLVLLGQVLELRAREQTGGAIRALLKLAPKTARRLDGWRRAKRKWRSNWFRSAIACGYGPATACRLMATLLEGRSAVDESMVTGESMPAAKQPGDKLIGGTVNGTGALVMRAEKSGADTHARAHRDNGRRGAAQPSADPADGGQVVGVLRPVRLSWRGASRFVAWAI